MTKKNPFGHPQDCECPLCIAAREGGWDRMKAFALTVVAFLGISDPEAVRDIMALYKYCGGCDRIISSSANFCSHCGCEQE